VQLRPSLSIAMLLAFGTAAAAAADPPETYGIKEAAPATGTMIKRAVITGAVPFDKRYDQMTPEQRQRVKDLYEPMAPNDEPPFPADGLAPLMKALQKAATSYRVTGPLELVADIGPDGAPRKVDVLRAPDDPQFRAFATSLLMVTRYKPAVCGGRACAMGFPLQANIVPANSPEAP
jgi:hypothetical protein